MHCAHHPAAPLLTAPLLVSVSCQSVSLLARAIIEKREDRRRYVALERPGQSVGNDP
jgi:hypothetical protein